MKKDLARIIKVLKSKTVSRLLPLFAAGLILGNFVLVKPAHSTAPQFNFFPNDPKTLRIANSTQRTDWQTKVNAKEGDTISFLFYYHNGVENTVAKNTHLRVDLPRNPRTRFTITGFLWADNTSQVVTDTVELTTNKKLILKYISHSTKWYPNRAQKPKPLYDGITSTKGVNIGDIKGCWPYAGYVVFQARLVSPPKPKLALAKKVANATLNQGTYKWRKKVSAKKGNTVAFNLFLYNPGNALLKNILVQDKLPAGLVYVPGSTWLYQNNKKTKLKDGITAKGITIHSLAPGIEKGVYIVFQAKVKTGQQKALTNTATATAGNLRARDSAYINILMPQIARARLIKTVRNLSRGEKIFSKSTVAAPGEEVEFRIIATNTGNQTLTNLVLKDQLPKQLTSLSALSWYWGQLEPQKSKIVFVRAKVKNLAPGTYHLTNKATLSATQIETLSDEAEVRIKIAPPAPVTASYKLDKKVQNLSKGDGLWLDNNQSYAGDIFEYKIYFRNTGAKTETITLTDDLPLVVGYINGSGQLQINGQTKTFSSSLFSNKGISFNLAPNQEGTIRFRVKVADNLAVGSEFTNCAYLKSSDILLKDCVLTKIKPRPQVKAQIQELPPTGGTVSLPFSLLFALLNYAWYRRLQKQLG